MKSIRLFGLAVLTLMSFGAQAALLEGKSIRFEYYFPDTGTLYPAEGNGDYVVGAGVEIPNMIQGVATVDFDDTGLLIDFGSDALFTAAAFNGFRLFDFDDSIAPFGSVSINALSNLLGLDAGDISFDDDNIWVNFQGLTANADTVVRLDIAARVPEPATLMLLGSALGLLGFTRRR